MSVLKKIGAWLKSPRGPVLWAIWAATLAAVAGAIVLTTRFYDPPAVYFVYAFAALTAVLLAYSVYTAVKAVPRAKAAFLARVEKHPAAHRFFRDYGFRTVAFGVFALLVNVGYAVLQMVLAIIFSSVWYGVLAGYYFCLGALRCLLVAGWNRVKKRAQGDDYALADGKLRLYRLCGVALLLLEIALTAAVTQMVMSENASPSSEVMAISSAAYTFYRVGIAIWNVTKSHRLRDPLLQSFRNIGLTDAAVALLALETTMIATFGGETSEALLTVRATTGFAVCALTVALGVFMIVRGTQRLKTLQQAGGTAQGAARQAENAALFGAHFQENHENDKITEETDDERQR